MVPRPPQQLLTGVQWKEPAPPECTAVMLSLAMVYLRARRGFPTMGKVSAAMPFRLGRGVRARPLQHYPPRRPSRAPHGGTGSPHRKEEEIRETR